MIRKLLAGASLLVLVLGTIACGEDDTANNGQIILNNGMNNSNNGSDNNSNNGNNGTNNNNSNNSNNGTNSSNNGNNGTNGNNGVGCMELDPSIGACDPLCQSGCEAGENCSTAKETVADPVTSSCVAFGNGIQDATCTANTDCAKGFTCLSIDGGPKACSQFCRPGTTMLPQCPSSHECRAYRDNPRVGVCFMESDECKALPTDNCGDGQNCYDTANGKRCADFNFNGMVDDVCQNSTDCGEFQRCVAVSGGALTCRPICNPNGESGCGEGTTCNSLQDAEGNALDWGACY